MQRNTRRCVAYHKDIINIKRWPTNHQKTDIKTWPIIPPTCMVKLPGNAKAPHRSSNRPGSWGLNFASKNFGFKKHSQNCTIFVFAATTSIPQLPAYDARIMIGRVWLDDWQDFLWETHFLIGIRALHLVNPFLRILETTPRALTFRGFPRYSYFSPLPHTTATHPQHGVSPHLYSTATHHH